MPPLRVAVIGAGAFGRNHLRVYRELEHASTSDPVTLVALVEPNPELRQRAAEHYAIAAFASIDELLAANLHLDAASICVPTIHHAAVSAQLLRAGLDVLIEKPFAATLAQADEIIQLAHDLHRIVQIGHLERFNPAVAAAASRITQPMFFEAHRLSIFTPRSLDVDVVLDLMIHDLDIVLTFARSPIREVRAVGLPVLSRKVDIANIRVEFASGCVANFTASRVSTEQVRKLRLFQPNEYLSLDFARQELLSIQVDPALLAQTEVLKGAAVSPSDTAPSTPAALAAEGISAAHPSRGLTLTKLDPPRAEPLRLELEDFLASVRTRDQPRVTAPAGRAALALALEINKQIAEHAHRAGLA